MNLDRYKEIWKEGLVNAGYAANTTEASDVLNSYVNDWYGVDLAGDVQNVDINIIVKSK